MHLILRALTIASFSLACALLSRGAAALTYSDVDSFAVPTDATMMIYSPTMDALVLKNTASAIVAIDLETGTSTTRLANTSFTDISLSPSGRYVFAADYGGENIGYGTPAGTHYVHRLDLSSMTWDLRTAYIAGNVQAVSDTQLILKSIDQWVTFTNNAWGSGTALTILNSPSGCCLAGPAYYASVYYGGFRYDVRTGRLLHGDSGSSSQEIQAFRIVGNEFVKQEVSGIYGTAQGFGGSVALATDGSAFYYGKLQVDPLDVSHDARAFPELIWAGNGSIALGNGKYYDAQTGAQLGSLPFSTTVYAMNPAGDDFWAFDPATATVHHFVPSGTNVALAANGGIATSSSNFSSGATPPGAINGDRKGSNWNNGGGWKSAAGMPQWLQVDFAGTPTIDRVVLYDVQDNYTNPVEPTDAMTNPLYGSSFVDFTVSAWAGGAWVTLATVTNNNLVKRTVTFPAVTTDRIRVNVTQSADAYARLAEIEAFTAAAQGGPASTTTTLVSSANPSLAAVSVTFTATVNGSNPTGSVTFTDANFPIAGCAALPLTGSGNVRTAACATSALDAGIHHTIAAIYAGNASNAASGSNVIVQTVNLAPTTTSLASTPNPSIAGTPITFTVTVTGSDPSGHVDLQDGSIYISGCSDIAGITLTGSGNVRTGTCSTSALSVGTHSITATYYGNITNARSSSVPLQQVVSSSQAVPSTTTIASSANPSIMDAFVTFTATVTGNNPTGPIYIADGNLIICSSTLVGSGNSRTASCGHSLGIGTHSMTATYQGDLVNVGSTSSALSQVVNAPAPSTTTLASSPNPSLAGQTVTFTATVNATNPTGSVIFTDGGNPIGGCTSAPLAGGGNSPSALCTTAALGVGTHSIVAAYFGDTPNLPSQSSPLSQVVNPAPPGALPTTTTLLVSTANPTLFGAGITFYAQIHGTNPTGTVIFTENGNSISGCVGLPLAGSGNDRTTACSTTALGIGSHAIVATYSGDANNAASSNAPWLHIVNPAPGSLTTTQLATTYNPAPLNTLITFTATVNGNNPTGTVNFIDGTNTPVCNNQPVTGSGNAATADCFVTAAGVGAHSIVAVYSGDAANAPSTSSALSQVVVTQATTTIGLTSSVNPAVAGASVTFTATVAGWNPTGPVSFTDGGNPISGCTSVALTGSGLSRTALCSTTSLSVGTHGIVATYSGNAQNTPSTSGTLSQVVNPPQAGTSTTLASSANPWFTGATITLTATVTGISPIGTVTVTENNQPISGCFQVSLTGTGNTRTATCAVPSFTAGTHSLVATYSGDASNVSSVSSPLLQVINLPGATTTTIASSANPSTAGTPVTFTATVTGNNPGSPGGYVDFTDGGSAISGCSTVVFTGGSGNTRTASCSPALTAGTHSIVATYSANVANAASTSSPLSQVVNSAGGTTNVALAANGGVATSSSNFSSGTLPAGSINGDRRGLNWNAGGGWKSAAGLPQWLQVQFAGTRTIDRVVVYDVQDDFLNPVEPTDTMTNPLYGSSFVSFTVSGWDGANWVLLATVTSNSLVKRTVTFPAYATDRIRVNITQSADAYARLAEIEVWGQ